MPKPASPTKGATLEILRSDPVWSTWLDRLDAIGAPAVPVRLPDGDDLVEALACLAIPEEYQPATLAARSWIESDPTLTWILERSVELLRQHMGRIDRPDSFPALPEAFGEPGRCFHTWVYASILPDTFAWTRSREIPDRIVRETLAYVGGNYLLHWDRWGTIGLMNQDWLMLHARGAIFQLGRLHFERARLGGRTSAGIRAAGFEAEKGEPCLAVHIPGHMGPFPPEACDQSFAMAESFFARHFPDEPYRYAVCHSWLLDPQLADYLSPESNILAFQRRFRLAYTPEANDRITLEYVFNTADRPLEELPQRTTLERAVVYHLQNGRHWHGGAGWLPFANHPGKDNQ